MNPDITASFELMPADNKKQRGDAIALRYRERGRERLMVIDAGNEVMGETLVDYLRSMVRDQPIDHLVSTRMTPLATRGLRQVLAEWEVREFVTMAPWRHTDQLERHFAVDSLEKSWHESEGLFDIGRAIEQTIDPQIRIREVMAGDTVGPFTVLAPSWRRYIETFVPGLQSAARRRQVIRDTCLVLYGEFGGGTLLHLSGAGPQTISDVRAEAERLGIDVTEADTIVLPTNPRAFGSPPEGVEAFFGASSPGRDRRFICPRSANSDTRAYLQFLQSLPKARLMLNTRFDDAIYWEDGTSTQRPSNFALRRRITVSGLTKEDPEDAAETELDDDFAESMHRLMELMKPNGPATELGPDLPDEE